MLDKVLLQIAKSAILKKFDENYTFDEKKLLKQYPYLNKDGAVFVTLKQNKELRGCIGSIIAHKTLLDDLTHNALSASFSDPRFQALQKEELSSLNLEVSLLSEPKILDYENYEDLLQKVRPNIDGLILEHTRFRGTFLPQVWEQLNTPKLFLEHLSMKAGATPSIYSEHPNIYVYQVEHIEADFDEILCL